MNHLLTKSTARISQWGLSFLLGFLVFTSCSKDISHEAKVDHYYSILVQPPNNVQNATFYWIVHEFPEESSLTYSDLVISSRGNELTFLPDAAGKYVFKVVVYDKNEQAISKKYVFNVTAPPVVDIPEPKVPEPQPLFTESEPVEEQTNDLVMPETEVSEPEIEPEIISEEVEIITEEASIIEEPETLETVEEEKKVPVKPAAEKETAPKKVTPLVPSSSRSYTIQVSALPTLRKAEAVADTLVDLGFDVYIQRDFQEENETVWYRVRVGTFSTMTEARNASNAISSITEYETWIDRVREDL